MSTVTANEEKAKPQGKRKIIIENIENKARKQVAFSKRRKGLFKKAGELCTLCNAEIAVLTFSGAGKVFTFGHPTADEIINRYAAVSASTRSSFHYSRKEENERILSIENNANARNSDEDLFWWDEPVEYLGLEELEHYMASLKELRNNVESKLGHYYYYSKENNNACASCSSQSDLLDLNKAYSPLSKDA